jgi:tRNA pseudouridine55 synthase
VISGVVNLAKPRGPSSHSMVGWARRTFGQRRVGHAGTLDPRAEGVLVLLLGDATRLSDYAMAGDKTYAFTLLFGVETDSLDLDGAVVAMAPTDGVTREALAAAARRLTGIISMAPPVVSALRVDGKRLYERVRAGETVEPEPRPAEIGALDLLDLTEDDAGGPVGHFRVHCAKGTYVRSLGREIARLCGTVASVDRLVRERSGDFALADAVAPEEVEARGEAGRLGEVVLPPARAVASLARAALAGEDEVRAVLTGRPVPAPTPTAAGETVCILTADGVFFALAEVLDSPGTRMLQPRKVFPDLLADRPLPPCEAPATHEAGEAGSGAAR